MLLYTLFLSFIAAPLLEDYFWFWFLYTYFPVLNVYMATTECPPSVFMALANKKLVEANEKQNFELRRSKNSKNY